MEQIGFCGIIKLTTQIILRNLKHFLCIAVLLALPQALNFIVLGPPLKLIQNLVVSTAFLYKLINSQTPDEATLISNQQQDHSHSVLIFNSIFSLITSLLCSILVTFSVCRACINKSLDLKGSLRGVRRSVINLILTELVVAVVVFTGMLVAMVVMVIIGAVLSAVNADDLIIPVLTRMTIGVIIGGGLYMTVTLSLADKVAILEEKKGWEAVGRGLYLIKGSKGMALGLYMLYALLSMVVLFVCVSEEAPVVWRWGVGGISVGMQAMVAVCSMVSQVVLYMSCKSGHGEPLDTLLAASPQFGPQDLAPKYLDLESAPFATSSPY